MARVTVENITITPELLRRNPAVARALGKRVEAGEAIEADLQLDCENLLLEAGYWRRSPAFLRLDRQPPRGWFVHLHRAEGNPLLLDLLILGNDGRFLEVELKTAAGRLSRAQKALVDAHGVLARSLQAFAAALVLWEAAAERGRLPKAVVEALEGASEALEAHGQCGVVLEKVALEKVCSVIADFT